MKKEYVKPYLAFESFQLVAALAGGCQYPLNQAVDACGNLDVSALFGSDNCIENIFESDTKYEDICYQGFNGDYGSYLTS